MAINGLHYIDFSPYSDSMGNESDFRMSDVYFSAEFIDCDLFP